MKITIDNTITDNLHTVDVDNNGTVEDLKVLVEVATEIPIDDQLLVFQNSFLEDNTSKLKHLGMANGDIGKKVENYLDKFCYIKLGLWINIICKKVKDRIKLRILHKNNRRK